MDAGGDKGGSSSRTQLWIKRGHAPSPSQPQPTLGIMFTWMQVFTSLTSFVCVFLRRAQISAVNAQHVTMKSTDGVQTLNTNHNVGV